MNFGSDNTGPAHPRIVEAMAAAAASYSPPYGTEAAMEGVRDRIREIFEAPDAEVFLVATGTAANAMALASLVRPWQAVYCSRLAHIHTDECGAFEFHSGGSKLILVPETDGRMAPGDLRTAIAEGGDRGLHYVQPGAVSLAQVTELGTIYPLDRLRAVTSVAKAHGMPVHMDGARFANALSALGCSPAEMTWQAGVDAVSFGATKNGCPGVEAVVFFDPDRAEEFTYRRKRAGHLFSKHRMLSAQMLAYLDDGLWCELAGRANRMGARLADGLSRIAGAEIAHPVEANIIFLSLPAAAHARAIRAGADYFLSLADLDGVPDDAPVPARLVTNWATTEEEVDRYLDCIGSP